MEFQRCVQEVGERDASEREARLWGCRKQQESMCVDRDEMQWGKCGMQRRRNQARARGCDRKKWGKGSGTGGRKQKEGQRMEVGRQGREKHQTMMMRERWGLTENAMWHRGCNMTLMRRRNEIT